MATRDTLEFNNKDFVPLLFGAHNKNLNHLEQCLGITIADRGNILTFSGDENNIEKAKTVLHAMWSKLEADKKRTIVTADIDAELRFLNDTGDNKGEQPNGMKQNGMAENNKDIVIKTRKKTIAPRSPRQGKYLRLMQNKEMVFGLGVAGTGKTYLAVAMALSFYLDGKVDRLIFTRPAVEAGERLGFLPGDMKEKVDPYLRPIYDALQDMLPWDVLMKKMETGEIEIAPLAFMRGRTLSNAFVILDEAQNTTSAQMKMVLTRMGENSRMVITGDLTQTDLKKGELSGLEEAVRLLGDIDDIGMIEFDDNDVVRHHLVGKIVKAYGAKA